MILKQRIPCVGKFVDFDRNMNVWIMLLWCQGFVARNVAEQNQNKAAETSGGAGTTCAGQAYQSILTTNDKEKPQMSLGNSQLPCFIGVQLCINR